MSALPENLLYTEGHTWLRQDDDGLITIGITEHGQSLLGDLVFVQLPETGARMEAGGVIASVESVKSAWDVLAPTAIEVVEVNDALQASPETVNEEPYAAGWIVRCRALGTLPPLMDASSYKDFIGE
ncbi:MAG: glycine cleavage system protein GcvH [Halothiobacillaceae bacterium]|nr:MAG: glycine cleavage system protein GcvH [Halothiobacillaceae bacterium]